LAIFIAAATENVPPAPCSGSSSRKEVRWRARSSSERQAGTTSTNRNRAAFSSASAEASSIARASAARIGCRTDAIPPAPAAASERPTSTISRSSASLSTGYSSCAGAEAGSAATSAGAGAGAGSNCAAVHGGVELSIVGVVDGTAAAQPEQPLGEQQVDDDREVDQEPDDLQRRGFVDELVDLEREQHHRREEREVLGPALGVPQSDRLDPLHRSVDQERDADEAKLSAAQREELVEITDQADVLVLDRARPDTALEVCDHPIEGAADAVLVGRDEQDEDAEQGQDQEVEHAVERDQPQHDPVAERAAAERHGDLVAGRRERTGRG
jgi:hypothetical protein